MIKEHMQSGHTVSSWCREKGLRPQTYYYRLRKVREAACQTIAQEQDTTFVPVNFPVSDKSNHTVAAAYVQLETFLFLLPMKHLLNSSPIY